MKSIEVVVAGAGMALLLAVAPSAQAAPRYSKAFAARMGDRFNQVNSAEEKACYDTQITSEQKECFGAKAERWEARMAKAYRRQLATLPAARRAVLVQEQGRWTRVRKPFCDRYLSYEGTLYDVSIVACLFNTVYKRTHDIERFR